MKRALAFALAATLAGCSNTESASNLNVGSIDACEAVPTSTISELIGDNPTAESFVVERLAECVWTNNADDVTVRIERVPDSVLFVEHAIEATDPARVRPIDVGGGAVLFEDEAVLGRIDDQVALVTGSVETEALTPVLDAVLVYLEQEQP